MKLFPISCGIRGALSCEQQLANGLYPVPDYEVVPHLLWNSRCIIVWTTARQWSLSCARLWSCSLSLVEFEVHYRVNNSSPMVFILCQIMKLFPISCGIRIALSCEKQLANGFILCQISPIHILHISHSKIHLNITLTSIPRSSKWTVSFMLSDHNSVISFFIPFRSTFWQIRFQANSGKVKITQLHIKQLLLTYFSLFFCTFTSTPQQSNRT